MSFDNTKEDNQSRCEYELDLACEEIKQLNKELEKQQEVIGAARIFDDCIAWDSNNSDWPEMVLLHKALADLEKDND